ncbi:uncharacterized protein LOC106181746 [Lingula anatina]|uniref:Uncharacterized protein LOC106181746 n=1 Tax=Lingula anatina TaxID=7574 RepID=A0A1S3KGB2_LINAN|nr:uncharacterized protein LOC106181746 [Lingula anatina]|eukprot:XP_013421673.1 uncharacterized protein LOC106181746 [Lingula anatina]
MPASVAARKTTSAKQAETTTPTISATSTSQATGWATITAPLLVITTTAIEETTKKEKSALSEMNRRVNPSDGTPKNSMPIGMIVGLTVGTVGTLLFVALFTAYIYQRLKRRKQIGSQKLDDVIDLRNVPSPVMPTEESDGQADTCDTSQKKKLISPEW